MQKLIDFLISNWDALAGFGGTMAGMTGWLSERKKRMRDNRDADVAFWEKTIDRQDAYILKLESRMDAMQLKYESQINELLKQVEGLSERLDLYEPRSSKIPHTL